MHPYLPARIKLDLHVLLKPKHVNKFQVVAETRSSEAFVALCLLTVAGTSLLTQKLGFSDTVSII